MKKHTKQLQTVYLIALFIVFGITRLWQLGTLPLGVHIDEAGMAYDAWCLANFGVDRYLKSWPVYLINFYSGQSSLYAFVCALSFSLGEFSVFFMRLPGTLFSLLTLIFGMLLARRLYPKSALPALAVGTLITICPYFIMGSRFGLDCNLMLGASTVFLYFFVLAIQTGKYRHYFLSGLTGGILLYSYVLTYIVLPLFLIFSLIYVLWVKKFSFRKWVVMAVPMGILAYPLILVQVVNYFDLPERTLGIFTITKMRGYRIGEVGGFSLNNIGNTLRCFFVGDANLFDSVPGIWNLYGVTVVLFFVGLISVLWKLVVRLRKRQCFEFIFPLLWLLSIFALSCSVDMRTYRLNGIFYVAVLLAAEGACVLFKFVGKCLAGLPEKYGKRLVWIPALLLCGIYLLCFARFGRFYYTGLYTQNTYLQLKDFGLMITDGIEFIEGDEELSQKVTYVWERSIYYAVSVLPEPRDFNVVGDSYGLWNNYHWGSLGEIDEEHNYMVPHGIFPEYCEALKQAGFEEKAFQHYSVYYKR